MNAPKRFFRIEVRLIQLGLDQTVVDVPYTYRSEAFVQEDAPVLFLPELVQIISKAIRRFNEKRNQ